MLITINERINVIKRLLFGGGEIANRLLLDNINLSVFFSKREAYIGARCEQFGHTVDLYICVIPCLPIHICFIYHDPHQ